MGIYRVSKIRAAIFAIVMALANAGFLAWGLNVDYARRYWWVFGRHKTDFDFDVLFWIIIPCSFALDLGIQKIERMNRKSPLTAEAICVAIVLLINYLIFF